MKGEKRTSIKKGFSLLIIMIMVMSLLPTGVWAENYENSEVSGSNSLNNSTIATDRSQAQTVTDEKIGNTDNTAVITNQVIVSDPSLAQSDENTISASMNMSELEQKLNQFQAAYGYYNHSYYKNSDFGLASECHGYARLLTKYVFGVECMNGTAAGWTKLYNINQVSPGDLIRYNNDGHSVFVTGVSGDTVTYTEANYTPWGYNAIRWGVQVSKSHFKGLNYIAHYNANPVATTPADTTDPTIHRIWMDNQSGTGRMMYIETSDDVGIDRVWCPTWAPGEADYFSKNASPQAGSNTVWMCAIMADDHGMKQGEYTTHVYAFDKAGNKSANGFSFFIDWENPSITNVRITDADEEGFTVRCNVSDNCGIERVNYATWTDANGQDPIKWADGSFGNNESSYRVLYSDHNNERGSYKVDIRAYDKAGNIAGPVTTGITIDEQKPVISNVEIVDKDSTGYTVKLKASDESGILKVQFPTWTDVNVQDDLAPDWPNNPAVSGTIDGENVTFRVNDSEHNFERGKYITHIYAYDKFGNYSQYGIETTVENIGSVASEETLNNQRYMLLDDVMTWSEARSKAEAMGGHLVTITSQEEQAVVEKLLVQGKREAYFIGGSDEKLEGTFSWITEELFGQGKWAPGEPNNHGGNENYLEIYRNGVWNDNTGTAKRGFIVEKEGTGLNVDSFVAVQLTDLQVNSNIPLTATVSGGSQPYQYKFSAALGDFTQVIQGYTETATAFFNPTTAGDYTLTVEVKDAFGNTGSQSISLKISEGSVSESGFVAFLAKDPQGYFYEYNAADLNKAYLAYQINPALASAKMYQQFANSQCSVLGLKDQAKGYMDYSAAAKASLWAQIKGEAFDINAYFAGSDAKLLEETVSNVRIVDKGGNIH